MSNFMSNNVLKLPSTNYVLNPSPYRPSLPSVSLEKCVPEPIDSFIPTCSSYLLQPQSQIASQMDFIQARASILPPKSISATFSSNPDTSNNLSSLTFLSANTSPLTSAFRHVISSTSPIKLNATYSNSISNHITTHLEENMEICELKSYSPPAIDQNLTKGGKRVTQIASINVIPDSDLYKSSLSKLEGNISAFSPVTSIANTSTENTIIISQNEQFQTENEEF